MDVPKELKDWDGNLIDSNLVLTELTASENEFALKYYNVKAVLSILSEVEFKAIDPDIKSKYNISFKNKTWLHIKYEDTSVNADQIQKDLHSGADFINYHINKKNQCVLVHCWAGISRSSTMVIAYLIKYKNMTYSDASRFVRKKRPKIQPNYSFQQGLLKLEEYCQNNPINQDKQCCVIL